MKDAVKEFEYLKQFYGYEDAVMVFLLDPALNTRYGVTIRNMEYCDNNMLRVYQDDPDYPYDEYEEDEILEGIEYTDKMLYELQWGFWNKYVKFSEYMEHHYCQHYPLDDGKHHMKLKSFKFVNDTNLKHLDIVCETYLGGVKTYSVDGYCIGQLDLLTDYMKQGMNYEIKLHKSW